MSSARTSDASGSSCVSTGDGELTEEQRLNREQNDIPNRLRLQSFIDQYGTIRPRLSTLTRTKNHLRKVYNTLSLVYIINGLLDRIPLIRCLKEYNIRHNLFGDVIAGITVAIMHIPQGTK
jgi:hypothetical protein